MGKNHGREFLCLHGRMRMKRNRVKTLFPTDQKKKREKKKLQTLEDYFHENSWQNRSQCHKTAAFSFVCLCIEEAETETLQCFPAGSIYSFVLYPYR